MRLVCTLFFMLSVLISNAQTGLNIYEDDQGRYLKLGYMMQARYSVTSMSEENVQNMQLNRFRIRINSGINTKLRFKAQLFFDNPSFNATPLESAVSRMIFDAFAEYDLNDRWMLTVGQFNVNGPYEFISAAHELEFVDRSILTRGYAYGRDRGIMIGYKTKFAETQELKWHSSITSGENWMFSGGNAGGLMYLTQLEYYPFGQFKGSNASEGDHLRHEEFKMMIAGGYSLNHNAARAESMTGPLLIYFDGSFSEADFYSSYANINMKYKGFAFQVNGVYRVSDIYDPAKALNAQFSIPVYNNTFLALRYAGETNEWSDGTRSQNDYRIGLTHNFNPFFKVQADYGINVDWFEKSLYSFRLQTQILI